MALKKFEFAFGHGSQTVELPEEHISDILEGKMLPAVDIKEATLNAMRNPIHSKPLQKLVRKGDKVCLIVADITRIWNQSNKWLIYVIDELNQAGIPDEDMFIVFAQGSHRAHVGDENVQICGAEVAKRIKMYQHDCQAEDMVDLGLTKIGTHIMMNRQVYEADKTILIDGITTHLFAGYGGGRKLILPGVVGFDTIQENHCHALHPEFGHGINMQTRSTLIETNPLNDDMLEACRMINPTFLVHSVLNADGEICRMVGGNWYDAWLAGTETVYEVQKAPMKQKADVVFACAGGYPKDINLYQGCKCYDPAEAAVKDDGIVIAIIEAPDIKEPAIYMDSFRFDTPADMEAALRAHFTIPFYVAFTLFSLDHRNKVILVTKPENKEDVIRTGQVPVATVQEAWDIAKAELEKRGNKDYTINVMPHCASVFPVLTGK